MFILQQSFRFSELHKNMFSINENIIVKGELELTVM
jgi:hypothetical protein